MATQYFRGRDGIRLAADVGGPRSAPTVILMHGGGQTRHSWGSAFRDLVAAGYQVVSLDARGHGESEWAPDGDYGIDALCADLHAVVATLNTKPALVGASMGGVTSLVAAGEDPLLASLLILVDIAPNPNPAGIAHIHSFMTAHPDGFANLEEAADAVAAYNPHRPRPKDTKGLSKNLRQRDNGRWYWHWDPQFVQVRSERKHLHIKGMSERMLDAADKIRIPTLLVRGKQTDVVSMEGVNELRLRIPKMEFVDVAGAGHMVAGDRNDAFNQAVTGFLAHHLPA